MKQKSDNQEQRADRAYAAEVLRELRKFWLKGPAEGRVILAVSGGVDSMTLLEGMSRLVGEPGERSRLLVLHVNHALRGGESDADERLVLERARSLGLEARSVRLDWSGASPSQDLCRRRRDEIFRAFCAGSGDRVWLAHHLNDQAETVFFRLLRGTGARGLRGMLPENGRKVRPLLGLEKLELLGAARYWEVPWREDRSNLDPEAYDRNWLRSFFPLLETRRPGFQRKLAALADEARGWRFLPEPGLETFSPASGIRFARAPEPAGPGVLAETFSLSRRHAQALGRLLEKPAGRLDAEGVRFTWSARVLLCEHGGSRFDPAASPSGGGFESALGRWHLPAGISPWGAAGGERRKKEFQALGVPGFFRSAVPLVTVEGSPVALVPRRLEDPRLASLGLRFTPSPLGEWWLGRGGNEELRV